MTGVEACLCSLWLQRMHSNCVAQHLSDTPFECIYVPAAGSLIQHICQRKRAFNSTVGISFMECDVSRSM